MTTKRASLDLIGEDGTLDVSINKRQLIRQLRIFIRQSESLLLLLGAAVPDGNARPRPVSQKRTH